MRAPFVAAPQQTKSPKEICLHSLAIDMFPAPATLVAHTMSGKTRGIQSFGGNMPFLGGWRIASVYGERYTDWLTEIYGGTGDTDYVATSSTGRRS